MKHLQRATVYVAFLLLVLINYHAFSSSIYLYKGINHHLPPEAVAVFPPEDGSQVYVVPVLDRYGGVPTGRTVEVLVHNSYYDHLRVLPILNVLVVLVAFVAYGLVDVINWRRQQRHIYNR